MEVTPGEPRCEDDVDPQELASTSRPNVEDLLHFSFFIPRGARVTRSPWKKEEEEFTVPVALILSQRPQPYEAKATQVAGTSE